MKFYSIATLHIEYTENGHKRILVLDEQDVMRLMKVGYGDKDFEKIDYVFHNVRKKVDEEQL